MLAKRLLLPLSRDPLLYGVVLIAVAVCAPFFRNITWLGDEGVVLHAAVRILDGEVLYRDFFEFLPPGGFLIVATWMKLFGIGFTSARVLAVGVIAAIAALLYTAARLASGTRPLAALLAISWTVLSQGAWTVISHHWLTTAASMASAVGLLLALEGASRRGAAFAAGLFAGVAVMVTQTRGALLCFAVLAVLLTLPRARVHLASAIAGVALVPTVTILYLAAAGALTAALDDVIAYPVRHYAGIQAVPFGRGATLWNGAWVALFGVAFALGGATFVRNRVPIWREPRFRASLALAIVGLVGIYPRPDIHHINFTIPLACPLGALVATDLLGRLGRHARTIVSAVLIGLCLPNVGNAVKMATVVPLRTVPTARGLVVGVQGRWTDEVADLMARVDGVPPGDAFFFYPYSPMLPYLTGRRHVAALDVMTPGYTTAEHFRETCVRVVREAQWVVIERMWTDPRVLRAIFPAIRDPDPPEKRAFEAALRRGFDKILHTSALFELRQRAEGASVALCDEIGAKLDRSAAAAIMLAHRTMPTR